MKKLLLAGAALAWAGGAHAVNFVVINFSGEAFYRGYLPGDVPPPGTFPQVYDFQVVMSGQQSFDLRSTNGLLSSTQLVFLNRADVATISLSNYDFSQSPAGVELVASFGGSGRIAVEYQRGQPSAFVTVPVQRVSIIGYDVDPGVASTFGNSTRVVPEPATWAMLIVGFGVIGLAARRRRRSHPATGNSPQIKV